ncbi:LysR family transcriptional regulator [Neobacillus niacini]|uniref:LysR family transcriptional regulator n=1 Tax=Neobacillus niacini TaxID=86668 RepID=UPI0021CB6D5C|nr:LysR family transcriptional regulator [Neobacillus niacini]MCM3766214.1 LysR family transcriptional regulator [Neobacillus niacini]
MNLVQLEFIVEIAKVNNISKASNILHVSQSGISQSLTSLEEELGVKIFDRSRSGVFPTEDGKIIIQKAQEILNQIEDLKSFSQSKHANTPVEIKISLTPGFIVNIQEAIASFKSDYPHVNIVVYENISKQIIQEVMDNEIDLGLIGFYRNKWQIDKELAFQQLFKTMVKVCVGKHSPFASRKTITHEDLKNQSIVLYNSDAFNRFAKVFEQKYGPLNILFRTNNYEVIKKTVMDGDAFSLFTDVFAKNDPDVRRGDIIPLTLLNFSKANIDYGWIYSKKRGLTDYASELIEYLNPFIINKAPSYS